MQAYTDVADNGNDRRTEKRTKLSPRTERALTEEMTVLPDTGRAEDAPGLFLVIGESGADYLVDARVGRCECPDAEYNLAPDEDCKHERRVRFATGARPLPATESGVGIDPQLGRYTDAEPLVTAYCEGSDDVTSAAPTSIAANRRSAPRYTYHRETDSADGSLFIKCGVCGAESVPADPERVLHCDDCPGATAGERVHPTSTASIRQGGQ